jgi:antitoxin MazE
VKLDIIKIGNSRGIRLPKALLEQCGFKGQVEAEVRGRELVLTASARRPREGWAATFAAAAAEGSTEGPLMGEFGNEFDESEWTWEPKARRK